MEYSISKTPDAHADEQTIDMPTVRVCICGAALFFCAKHGILDIEDPGCSCGRANNRGSRNMAAYIPYAALHSRLVHNNPRPCRVWACMYGSSGGFGCRSAVATRHLIPARRIRELGALHKRQVLAGRDWRCRRRGWGEMQRRGKSGSCCGIGG